LLSLLVNAHSELSVDQVPRGRTPLVRDGGFDVPDDEYAAQVKAVLENEIAQGEGANFVLRRSYTGYCDDPLGTALSAFHHLLKHERGAYWTLLIHTGDQILVGATPERHVSLRDGIAVMNPISGTLRKPPAEASAEEVLAFLDDPKERDELAMVVDEELKMLAELGGHGRVVGPFLKQMRHLAHTEYYIEARTSLDPREILRTTMFAPTATGSPIRNAFRVIARHETGGRGYYGGIGALLGTDGSGGPTMDASLLLRMAYLNVTDGRLSIPVGATLVRGSDAYGEVLETYAKAQGVLRAFGVGTGTGTGTETETETDRTGKTVQAPPPATAPWTGDPRIRAALQSRNAKLAPFWLAEHGDRDHVAPELHGRSVLIVDNEDAFTSMLTVHLQAFGMNVVRTPYAAVDGTAGYEQHDGTEGFDLVILGPGPGDPRDAALPKVRTGRALIERLLTRGQPLFGVCLGHQLLCAALGLNLLRRPVPHQGTQVEAEVFGRRELLGFYNSFSAVVPESPTSAESPMPGFEFATLDGSREIVALRGPGLGGVQFHAESILTYDGLGVLRRELSRLLPPPGAQ
jgi:phenazine biosynthesis protein phzE